MGKFGPGTTKNLNIKRKDWKAIAGAIENKNRPEAVYITFSTWFQPKLSIVKAQSTSTAEPENLVKKVARDFEKEVERASKKFRSFFDPKYFDSESIIFYFDFAYEQAKVGKRQFLELEINIDTINDIDFDDNPTPNSASGKINHIPFKDFLGPLTTSINKILELDAFSERKAIVSFAKVKGAK